MFIIATATGSAVQNLLIVVSPKNKPENYAMSAEKHVVVSSFHSGSLQLLKMQPEAIISFDGHLDTSYGGGSHYLKEVLTLPFPLNGAFLRTSVHALLRRALPKVPIHLVVPETCYLNDIYHDQRSLSALKDEPVSESYVKSFKDKWIEEFLGIKLFLSPPRNLKHLFKSVKKHTTVLDIDIDYMQEFQDDCYSRAPRIVSDDVEVTKLGSLQEIRMAVSRVHPKLVLVSEIKRSEIDDQKSGFSKMMNFFENLGYELELGQVVENDKIAFRAIEVAMDFEKKVLPAIRKKAMDERISDEMEYLDLEFANALRVYLTKLDLTMWNTRKLN